MNRPATSMSLKSKFNDVNLYRRKRYDILVGKQRRLAILRDY